MRPLLVLLCTCVLATAASANPSLRIGPRVGLTSDPDQINLGGTLAFSRVMHPRIGVDVTGLVGLGDNLTVMRFMSNVLFFVPLQRGLRAFPLLGVEFDYYDADCGNGFGDCSGTEVGLNLGGGLDFRRFRIDAWFGFGDIVEVTVSGAYLFPF